MKKSNFKRIVSVLLVLCMSVAVMSGCGSNKGKDEQGRTIVSVGSWPTSEGTTLDNMNARKAQFESDNTDVVIQPDSWAFDLKTFYAKAAGGQLPTVYPTHFTEIAQIIDAEYAADITDVLKDRGYEGKFNQQVLDLIGKDGKVFGFPFETYILGLAYNTEMFEKAGLMNEDGTPKQPKDWYELAEFAVKIKEATGKPGFVFPTANNYGGWIFTSLAWSFGTKFMEKGEDGKWTATFNSPEAAEALQFIKDLKWKYDVLPSNTIVDGTELYKLYATDNAGMLISAGDFPKNVYKYEMHPDKCGIMEIPAGPKRHVTLIGGMVYCINEDATKDQIDAAIRWLETESSYKISDSFKTTKESKIKQQLDRNQLVGIKSMSPWSEQAETLQFENSLIEKNANSNLNHVKLYNDFVANCTAEIQAEEPVCAQELYGVLDGCIQQVLIDENADCAELLEKANADFQKNYLNNITY